MSKYLDPKADLTFKKVFGEHKDLVISLLNALLPLDAGNEVDDIEYLSPELVPETPTRKFSIVDVRCHDTQGRQFIVEMQMLWSPEFKNRVMFNASKAYVRQLNKSVDYELLQPVYSLNLVNEVFEQGTDSYYHHYAMVHVEDSDRRIEGLHLVFVELPKFKAHSFGERKMQVLWLKFLTQIDENTSEAPGELLSDPQVRKALDVLEESAFSDDELNTYDKFWDMIRTERTYYASGKRQGFIEGEEQGIEKGIAIGEERGIAIGEDKGRSEERIATASKLLRLGVDRSVIEQATGLTPEEIDRITAHK